MHLKPQSSLIKPFWDLLQLRRSRIIKGVLFGTCIQGLNCVFPYLTKVVIDRSIGHHVLLGTANLLVLGIVAIEGSVLALKTLQSYQSAVLSATLQFDVSERFYRRVYHLPLSFFQANPSGGIARHFDSLRTATTTILNLLNTLGMSALYVLIIPFYLFYLSPGLSIVSLPGVPLTVAATILRSRGSRGTTSTLSNLNANVTSFQSESLGIAASAKGLDAADQCISEYSRRIADVRAAQVTRVRRDQRYTCMLSIIKISAFTATLAMGCHSVLIGRISAGTYVAFLAYLNYLYSPLADLANNAYSLGDAAASARMICSYAEQVDEFTLWRGARTALLTVMPSVVLNDTSDQLACLALNDISFSYNDVSVLVHTSARFEKGVNVLTGPSGCGKTTLLQLIAGCLIPSAGHILWKNRAILLDPLSQWRKEITAVWQDPSITTGTLRSYLQLGCPTLGDDYLQYLLTVCELDTFVARLAAGLDTHVGTCGSSLSSGQKQRLSLVRGLARRSAIICLDEPLANVEQALGGRIMRRLTQDFTDTIIIIASHQTLVCNYANTIYQCANEAFTLSRDRFPSRECMAAQAGRI